MQDGTGQRHVEKSRVYVVKGGCSISREEVTGRASPSSRAHKTRTSSWWQGTASPMTPYEVCNCFRVGRSARKQTLKRALMRTAKRGEPSPPGAGQPTPHQRDRPCQRVIHHESPLAESQRSRW